MKSPDLYIITAMMKMKSTRKHSKKGQTIAFTDIEDKLFGKKGTPQRQQYDTELNEEIIGELIKQARQKQNLTQAKIDLDDIGFIGSQEKLSKAEQKKVDEATSSFIKTLKKKRYRKQLSPKKISV